MDALKAEDAGQDQHGGILSKILEWGITIVLVAVVACGSMWALLQVIGSATDDCRYDAWKLCVVQEDVGPIVLSDGSRMTVHMKLQTPSSHSAWIHDLSFDATAASTDLRDTIAVVLNKQDAAEVWRDPAAAERSVARAIEARWPWLRVTFVRLDAAA